MMSFRENYGQIFSSRGSSVNSETPPATATSSTWPNVAAQGFHMDMANSSLWDDKMESPPAWSTEKVELPLWDTDMKDPSCTWDLDLSHQLAAKLLMIDDQPSQVLDQQMFSQDSFNYAQDMSMANTTANPRFKTEICRNFKEKGTCLYGDLCQFAHGKHELRKDVVRHNKYKTKLCQKYWIAGYCAYGPRCNFIHQEKEGLATLQAQELPAQVRSSYSSTQATLYKTAADVIGLANARKSSLGDSGDSGSDEAGTTKMRGFHVPTFYPREKDVSGQYHEKVNQLGYAREGAGLGGHCGGAGPVGSGRPGMRVVWPGA